LPDGDYLRMPNGSSRVTDDEWSGFVPSQTASQSKGVKAVNLKSVEGSVAIWLCRHLSEVFDLEPQEIDMELTFARYGLDSASLIAMTGELSEWLGCNIDPAAAFDFPSVSALAQSIASRAEVQQRFFEDPNLDGSVSAGVSAAT
jgi:acyl carrier protein